MGNGSSDWTTTSLDRIIGLDGSLKMVVIITPKKRHSIMATLKTNTLTGTSTAGSIAVTGEGNSTTTNLQKGLRRFGHSVLTM